MEPARPHPARVPLVPVVAVASIVVAARARGVALPFVVMIAVATSPGCKDKERAAPPPDLALSSAAASAPSFKRQIAPYLVQSCAQANGCHGAHPSMSVDLDLRGDGAYAQLVGRYSEQRVGGTRVKPGDVEGSFLVAKLTGALRKGEGKTMPIDPQTGAPVLPVPIDPDFVNNLLRPWIAAGAPNN